MIKIALCDDEEVFADFLAQKIKLILDEMKINYSIDIFVDPSELLDIITHDKDAYQLYFLDILMEEVDGITLAEVIRKKKSEAIIIFITATSDYALKGYDVRAFRYIVKPICEIVLKNILEEVYESFFKIKSILVKCKTQLVHVNLEDIYYLEIQGRKVAIHMPEKTMLVSSKLSEIEEKLPLNKFCRTHQSFIVNLDYITELKYGELLIGERKVPISRSFQKGLQKAFLNRLSNMS